MLEQWVLTQHSAMRILGFVQELPGKKKSLGLPCKFHLQVLANVPRIILGQ
jgi:hypothetical protein